MFQSTSNTCLNSDGILLACQHKRHAEEIVALEDVPAMLAKWLELRHLPKIRMETAGLIANLAHSSSSVSEQLASQNELLMNLLKAMHAASSVEERSTVASAIGALGFVRRKGRRCSNAPPHLTQLEFFFFLLCVSF